MILTVRATLRYRLPAPTDIVLRVAAARADDQRVLDETLATGLLAFSEATDAHGRIFRGRNDAPTDLVVDYGARIDNGDRAPLPPGAAQAAWRDLPPDVYPFLLPSRFCPSDRFLRFANREFGGLAGSAKVHTILDWIHGHVDYVPGISDASTTAAETFVDRAGVCRDFAHLAITLVRASGIAARAVAAYALKLDPPDFHAVAEVWLDGRWWLVDPTRLAPIEGLVRIADGRDAADIAFLTTSGAAELVEQSVTVTL
jgi:transglutaminase-like putative cysteine protease